MFCQKFHILLNKYNVFRFRIFAFFEKKSTQSLASFFLFEFHVDYIIDFFETFYIFVSIQIIRPD